MATTNAGKIGIGARGQFAYSEESTWGTAVAPTQRIDFKTESLTNEIGNLVSEALDPNRATTKRIRGVSNVAGDVTFEQSPDGYEVIYKHALGDAITVDRCDGGVRTQLTTALASNVTSMSVSSTTGFITNPSSEWELAVVYKDASNVLQQMLVTYSAVSNSTHFTITATGSTATPGVGAWVFQAAQSGGSGYWDNVYTHYIEAAKDLPAGLTLEVGRDIAFFVYNGCKVNTFEMTFNAQEILQGTFGFIGKAEYAGADLASAAVASGATIRVENYTTLGTDMIGFNSSGGTVQIGTENDVDYTSYDATTGIITITDAANDIAYAHVVGEPVVPSTSWATVTAPPVVDPLSSFEAGVYLDGTFQEVLGGSVSFSNNLFTDKFQLGARFRAGLPDGLRTVEGSVNIEFDDMIMYRKFVNGTAAFLEFRCVQDGTRIDTSAPTSAAVYRQMHVLLPNIEFTGTTPNVSGPDMIVFDMGFVALRDETNNMNEIAMIFVNTKDRNF